MLLLHITVCIYTVILKYDLLHLYNVICTQFFRTGHVALDNQLVYYSPGKTISSTLRIPCLPIILCAVLRASGLSLIHFGISVSVVLVPLMFRLWDFMGEASDIVRDAVSQQISWLYGSDSLSISFSASLFPHAPWVLGTRVFYRCIHWNSVFWLVVVSCNLTFHLEIGSLLFLAAHARLAGPQALRHFPVSAFYFATEALWLLMHTALPGLYGFWGF